MKMPVKRNHKILIKYLIVSTIVLLFSYIYQLTLHQDCAWDGCVPAHGITYIGSIFGLPALMLWPIVFVGIVILIGKVLAKNVAK